MSQVLVYGPVVASVAGDAARWGIFAVAIALILAFWWVVLSRFGSF